MTSAGTDVWRPYDDNPVLTPSMTGGHRATPPEEMEGDALKDWVVAEVLKDEEAGKRVGDGVREAKSVKVVKGGRLVNFVL